MPDFRICFSCIEKTFIAVFFSLLINGVCLFAASDEGIHLRSGEAVLVFPENKDGTYGVKIFMGNREEAYEQPLPFEVELISSGLSQRYGKGYETIAMSDSQSMVCSGFYVSRNGSLFRFIDRYIRMAEPGTFELSREVIVSEANDPDAGFSSRISFIGNSPFSMNDYDFFVPGIWYKDYASVPKHALASDTSDSEFWFREDRMPLPVFMMMNKNTGITFSVTHKDPEGKTFKEESGLSRIIDGRMTFASVGMKKNDSRSEVGVTYPGTEGERTYIGGASGSKRWAYRNHPVQKGFQQRYRIIFRMTRESGYATALENTWKYNYSLFSPAIYSCDLDRVYQSQISVMDKYWKTINGAAGLPFLIQLNGQLKSESDYNFNMGFVGHQPGNAFLLIREGLITNNPAILMKGEQMAEFWATESMTENGCPKTWYDPYPMTWRGPEVALREIGDGMIELIRAWNYERKYNRDKPVWLNACLRVADWVVSVQNADGSFYSHFNHNTGKNTRAFTNCTSHIIPFLVEMYMATGNKAYKSAALKAGDFIWGDVMNHCRYVGGAIDNPNVTDKEAASMAMRAFIALYDMQKSPRWMDAWMQTVYFYQSWVLCWNIPIPENDEKVIFPRARSMIGQSLIATGHSAADTYAAIDALGFYRSYLYSGDKQLLHFSLLLLHNTKQFMNWNPENDPVEGIAPGLFGEAMNICIPRGHGIPFYLPWATYNQMEPLVFLEDIFGYKEIEKIEQLPLSERMEKMNRYSERRMFDELTMDN